MAEEQQRCNGTPSGVAREQDMALLKPQAQCVFASDPEYSVAQSFGAVKKTRMGHKLQAAGYPRILFFTSVPSCS